MASKPGKCLRFGAKIESDARFYIAVPTKNRKALIAPCFSTLRAGMVAGDQLVAYDDGSKEFGPGYLIEVGADHYNHSPESIGIERQRRQHFFDFLAQPEDVTHLYLTDSDTIHDPEWSGVALDRSIRRLAPVCLYNTQSHVRLENNLVQDDPKRSYLVRRFAPGVSYLLTRDMVKKVCAFLHSVDPKAHWHWDWTVPNILGNHMIISRTCYVDHLGLGGMHHPPAEGWEGGDRALSPTAWLIKKRAEVIATLT